VLDTTLVGNSVHNSVELSLEPSCDEVLVNDITGVVVVVQGTSVPRTKHSRSCLRMMFISSSAYATEDDIAN
jgi:hypothetical protein